jgi:hypothetical protein
MLELIFNFFALVGALAVVAISAAIIYAKFSYDEED